MQRPPNANTQLTQLPLVAGAGADGLGEDYRVGGDADDLALRDHAGKPARLQARAAEVVEPDGNAGCGKILEGLGHGGFPGNGRVRPDVRQAATCCAGRLAESV